MSPISSGGLSHKRLSGGLVTMMMGSKQGLAPGERASVADPEQQKLIDKLSACLESRVAYKAKLTGFWVRILKHKAAGKMSPVQFEEFLHLCASDLNIPVTAFRRTDDPEVVLELYDFDGDGVISFTEGTKCVEHGIEKFRKDIGGAPVFEVPEYTPECRPEGGLTTIRQLGKGGQGTAMLVEDPSGKQLLMKVYDKTNANAGSINELLDEMEIMTKAEANPHIARCHEVFQDDTSLYMIGDPYFGGDLTNIREKATSAGVDMDEDWFRDLFKQAFSGLDYLHEKSVLHCDIKEENIMVMYAEYETPEVVIIDLGLASTNLHAGKVCGTPGYMPPEVWENGTWFPKGDVFSMGVCCIQLLTDNVPDAKLQRMGIFQRGMRDMEDCAKFTMEREPPYEDIDPYDDDIEEFLRGCLHKNWKYRSTPLQVLQSDWFKGEPKGCFGGLLTELFG